MTDFRAKGLKGKERTSYLAEIDEPIVDESGDDPEDFDLQAAQHEAAWLRKEVSELRGRLSIVRGEADDIPRGGRVSYPWVRIAVVVVSTLIVGKIIRRFR